MKEFNFKIEGNDVEDLLKVVSGNVQNKQSNNGCVICGSELDAVTNKNMIWNGTNGTQYSYNDAYCPVCGYMNIVK